MGHMMAGASPSYTRPHLPHLDYFNPSMDLVTSSDTLQILVSLIS